MLQSTEYTTADTECEKDAVPATYAEADGCPASCAKVFELASPLQTHKTNKLKVHHGLHPALGMHLCASL